jgi:glycosyltransferase involved in cell wall biosynthesis
MLAEGMKVRGHNIEVWFPQPIFFKLPVLNTLQKWMGYIDQYILFPIELRSRLKSRPQDTLFVFTDQALGPWVPLVKNRPHVIHCHDFLAQRSALGEIAENPTSWTGRQYQKLIHRGYSKGKCFISVSQRTQSDLHRFISSSPLLSEVVYNGLNQTFVPHDSAKVRSILGSKFGFNLTSGYLLHVGGNQFYKNRLGVIEIYNAWRSNSNSSLPLLLIGESPAQNLLKVYNQSSYKKDIHFLVGIEDEFVRQAYAGASVFIFPSLAEGFGWPIAEAMASGCPVLTTDEAPMSEVAGNAGFLISRRPKNELLAKEWAIEGSIILNKILALTSAERKRVIELGIENAKRFDSEVALSKIEDIYIHITKTYKTP